MHYFKTTYSTFCQWITDKKVNFFLLFLFSPFLFVYSQSPGITMHWDSEVGCQVSSIQEGSEGHPKYDELIQSSACLRVCGGSEIVYSLTGQNNSNWLSTLWNIAGGAIVSQSTTHCTVRWGVAGSGFIGATVNTTSGPSVVPDLCIEIMKPPVAHFGISPDVTLQQITACVGQDLYFTDSSYANGGSSIESYLWQFPDGTTSSEQNPVHAFDTPGSKIVTLVVRNECGCLSVPDTMVVKVKGTGINIVCPTVMCLGDQATYALDNPDAAECPEFIDWSVEGGSIISPMPYQQSIDVIWDHIPNDGFGVVTVNPASCDIGCASVTSVRIPVIRDNIPIEGPSTLCVNSQQRYTLPKWPTTKVEWTVSGSAGAVLIFTDQPNEVIIQTSNSSGTVILNAKYQNTLLNCGGNAKTKLIHVKKPLKIGGPAVLCKSSPATFSTNTSAPSEWFAVSPSGAVISSTGTLFSLTGSQLSEVGSYRITAYNPNYCDSARLNVQVQAEPEIPSDFNIIGKRIVCPGVPESYGYTNNVPGTIMGWSVSSGSVISGSSYGEEITAIFNGAGPLKVRVWRESTSEPHCRSKFASITIGVPDLSLYSIQAADPQKGAAPCPNTYQTYALREIASPFNYYTAGEVYRWSVVDPTYGSVSSANGTKEATILWNDFSTTVTTKVRLDVRKCDAVTTYYFDVTINGTPDAVIGIPDSICEKEKFLPAVIPSVSATDTKWFVDGSPADEELLPYISIQNYAAGNFLHTVSVVLSGVNGCPTATKELTKQIMILDIPSGVIVHPSTVYDCEQSFPFSLTVSQAEPAGATIQWFKDGNAIAGATGTSYTVTNNGGYYAVITNPLTGCSAETNVIKSLSCTGPCTPASPQSIALVSEANGCGGLIFTATPSPGYVSYQWGSAVGPNCSACSFSPLSADSVHAVYSITKPNQYSVTYTAFYLTAENTLCAVSRTATGIVPYIAKMEYDVECNPVNNNYKVTLKQQSPSYSTTPVTDFEFSQNGTGLGAQLMSAGNTQVLYLSPGTYNLGVEIWRSGYAHCNDSSELVLPAMPDAEFTDTSAICSANCDLICSDKALYFKPIVPQQTDFIYEWLFGDGSVNKVYDPSKVYLNTTSSPQTLIVSLNVSNTFGCYASDSLAVSVKPNQLAGGIASDPDPAVACENTSLLMSYDPAPGSSTATAFTWMNGFEPVNSTPDGPSLGISHSGAYWVKTSDAFGCTSETAAEPATIVMLPDIQISGPEAVCAGEKFSLSGYGGGTDVLYQWADNEDFAYPLTTASNANSKLSDLSFTDAGEYYFFLKVIVNDGISCERIYRDTVIVNSPPAPPVITSESAIECNPYTIQLRATASETGTFNWSDGQHTSGSNESVIGVQNGGPFQVRFTNEGGCSSTSQISIPKDPLTFLWLFPSGCMEICDFLKTGYLLAPIPAFEKWYWNHDGTPVLNASGEVSDFYPFDSGSGEYSLTLVNEGCAVESKPLNINYNHCRDCRLGIHLKAIHLGATKPCNSQLGINITNPTSSPISVVVTGDAGIGLFSPGNITVFPGSHTFAFDFFADSSFTGGSGTIVFETVVRGEPCTSTLDVDFPNCGGGGISFRSEMTDSGKDDLLTIVPNPASASVSFYFEYASFSDDASLEMYDMSGRLLSTFNASSASGRWLVDASAFQKGVYMIVMKQQGKVLHSKRLVID